MDDLWFKRVKTEPNFPTVEAIKGVNTDKDLAPAGGGRHWA